MDEETICHRTPANTEEFDLPRRHEREGTAHEQPIGRTLDESALDAANDEVSRDGPVGAQTQLRAEPLDGSFELRDRRRRIHHAEIDRQVRHLLHVPVAIVIAQSPRPVPAVRREEHRRLGGVHPQAEGFTEHQAWDFAGTRVDQYPLLRHFPYFDLYRKQVVKQADLVLAMQLCPDAFSAEQKERNFAYYEAVTVRDSSLSAGTQAVIAAETGHLDLAYDYLAEAALMDLEDLEHNTRDGLHIAALAGSWIALVDGFGGLRNVDGSISFAPRLPPGLTRLAFTVSVRGRRLRAEVTQSSASYVLADDGSPIEIRHHDDPVTVTAGRPQPRPIPPSPVRPRPAQPPGREPRLGGRVASLRPDDSKQPDDNEQQGGRGR